MDSQSSKNTLILNDPADEDVVTIGDGITDGLSYSVTAPVTGSYYSTATMNYGNITISNGGSSGSGFLYSNGAGNSWSTITAGTNTPSLHVTGEAEFENDITIKGVSIIKTLNDINKRLAILVPDPEKLEHFEALKKAYDHYKMIEALCELPKEQNDS